MFRKALKCHKYFLQIYIAIVSIYIFYLATTPIKSILCLLVFQMWCNAFTQNGSQWVQTLLIILSNDVHQNPGPPFHNSFFSFMSWNVNSIAKDDFQRVHLIEAHNSIFNYDLISICETSFSGSNSFVLCPWMYLVFVLSTVLPSTCSLTNSDFMSCLEVIKG